MQIPRPHWHIWPNRSGREPRTLPFLVHPLWFDSGDLWTTHEKCLRFLLRFHLLLKQNSLFFHFINVIFIFRWPFSPICYISLKSAWSTSFSNFSIWYQAFIEKWRESNLATSSAKLIYGEFSKQPLLSVLKWSISTPAFHSRWS